jgi:Na+-transporting methylmalonyl-CoA/oxaloacetate decarboxylase gamma subunit
MQNLEFGLTLTVLGMGGTLVILYLIGLVIDGMNKILLRGEKKEEGRG